MKIAIFGATGQTGLEAVKLALAANHSVTAVVRTPSKMSLTHPNLRVEEGNIFDSSSLSSRLAGHDAVLSCLGFPMQSPKVTGYLEATKAIAAAMEEANVKKLVVCHSWYTGEASRTTAPFIVRWVLIPLIRTVLDGMLDTEKWLDAECGLDYTVVRPAGLTNGAVTSSPFTAEVGGYEVASRSWMEGLLGGRIARADVARFMLDCLKTDEYNRKQVAIAV